jgi:hypothetical protein
MNHAQQLQQAARMWLNPNQRDVAEIRLDDLLNPTGEDAIVSIDSLRDDEYLSGVSVIQESGVETRIWLGGPIDHIPGGQ